MALANFAWILAANGKRVLAIDWDLEAPGLHRYFRPFLIDPELFETDGLIDVCWSFAARAMETQESPSNVLPDLESLGETLEAVAVRLDHEFASGGYIDFVGAGRQSATYSQRVNTFAWSRFYDIGGARLLQQAREHLAAQYDWVLIDSRTGVSDTAGICTVQLPDTVVACFTLNRQSVEGVSAILQSIRSASSEPSGTSRIALFPIATRIENAELARLEGARSYSRSLLADFLPNKVSPREYWDSMEIAYRPAYAFEEILAAYGDATGAAGAADTMLAQIEAIAQRISGQPSLRFPEVLEQDRQDVLAKYALGKLPPPPPRGPPGDDPQRPQPAGRTASGPGDEGADFVRGVLAKEQVWRSSGFRWRMLLSRRELDLLTEEDRKKFGRTMAYFVLQSERADRFLRASTRQFGVNIGLGLLAGAGYLAYRVGSQAMRGLTWDDLPSMVPVVSVNIAFYAFALFTVVLGVLRRSSSDAPYGLRWVDAVYLSFLGPFHPQIMDYEFTKPS